MPSIRVVRRARRARRILSASVVSLLLTAAPAAAQQPLVPVPQLAGQNLERARTALATVGLTLGRVDTIWTMDDVGFEMVVDQRPPAGQRVVRGTVVAVTYRVRGTGMVMVNPNLLQAILGQKPRVPELRGRSLQAAARALDSAGLRLGRVDTAWTSDDVGLGMVVDQRMAPGTAVETGTPIGVAIRMRRPPTPPANVPVPDVVNRPLDEASRILLEARLAVGGVQEQDAFESPAGTVLAQRPRGGTARVGTPVELRIASAWTEVPSLEGLDARAARAALARRQLVLGEATSLPAEAPVRSIIGQGFAAGARVRKGSAVSVRVAAPLPTEPQERVAVPEVVRLSLEAAERTLVSTRLRVGRVEEVDRFEARAGEVLEQDPRSQMVPIGTTVNLWVASPWTVVPALDGMGLAAARRALEARQLVLGGSRDEVSDAPAGSVVSQSLGAGTRVRKGRALTVGLAQAAAVSAGPDPAAGVTRDSIIEEPVNYPPAPRVPGVIGLSLAEARARLDSAGLALELGPAIRGSGLAAQLVAAQEPAANSPLPATGVVRLQLAAAFPWAQVLGVAVVAFAIVTLALPRLRRWLPSRGKTPERGGGRTPDVDFLPSLDDFTADLGSGTLVSPHALELVAVAEELRCEPVYTDTLTSGGRDAH